MQSHKLDPRGYSGAFLMCAQGRELQGARESADLLVEVCNRALFVTSERFQPSNTCEFCFITIMQVLLKNIIVVFAENADSAP